MPPSGGCREADVAEFKALAKETCLPTLDCLLYTNNIVKGGGAEDADAEGALPAVVEAGGEKRPQKKAPPGSQLRKVNKLLREHRARTLAVLKAIEAREAVLARLCEYVRVFNADLDAVGDEVQMEVMVLVYELQAYTLAVVEGIAAWRAPLTRPFAFYFKGSNYLLQIARDGRALAQSSIGAVLPLRLETYPLSSNVPSLKMFDACLAAPDPSGMIPPVSKASTVSDPKYVARLKRAEAAVANEFEGQLDLFKELIDLCLAGRFLPLLRTPLVPRCATGVRINSKKWTLRHAAALRTRYEQLTQPAPLPPELVQGVPSAVLVDDTERALLEEQVWGAELLVQ